MSAFGDKVRRNKSGFYKVADLNGKGEIVHTISHILEDVVMFDKEMDVLCFADTGKQLQLNQTNSEFLLDNFGEDPETYEGKQVALALADYEFRGETKQGIRLKLPGTPASTPKKNPQKPSSKPDFDDEIPY